MEVTSDPVGLAVGRRPAGSGPPGVFGSCAGFAHLFPRENVTCTWLHPLRALRLLTASDSDSVVCVYASGSHQYVRLILAFYEILNRI